VRHQLSELQSCAVVGRYRRGQEIDAGHNPAEHWRAVTRGAARQCANQIGGRRQIIDLLLPGDWFGFSASNPEHMSTEAIADDTEVISYPRRRLEILAEENTAVAKIIREMAFEVISRQQRQLLILGRITAPEKVGSLLLELAKRLPKDDPSNGVMLPVSRYDIADYLAISVETVSRSLTDLQHRGAIQLASARQVKIVDPIALDQPMRRSAASAA
jgi:CRP/FNR family transcriptional regulator, nitrogen fixation regulation protein